jgi:hypothetical protein
MFVSNFKNVWQFCSLPYTRRLPCGPRAEESRSEDTELHREALDEIRSDWAACGLGEAPSDREIVSVALHLMQSEIEAGLGDELVEELRREIDYRRWCATSESAPAAPITEGDRIA